MTTYKSRFNQSSLTTAEIVPIDQETIVQNTQGLIEVGQIGDSNITSLDASKLVGSIPSQTINVDDVTISNQGQLSIKSTYINQPLTTSSSVQFGDLSCSNLTVAGTTTTVNSTTVTVADTLLELASTNDTSDTIDMGWIGKYFNGTSVVYAGMVRDATNKQFYCVENLVDTNAPVNVSDRASFNCQDLDVQGNATIGGDIVVGGTVDGVDIAVRDGDLATAEANITTNTTNITTNTNNITTNTTNISTNTNNISTNTTNITTNTNNISTNATNITNIQNDLNGFPDALKNLTTDEIAQLENIGTSIISSADWAWIATHDNQGLGTTDSPTFLRPTFTDGLDCLKSSGANRLALHTNDDASYNVISLGNSTAKNNNGQFQIHGFNSLFSSGSNSAYLPNTLNLRSSQGNVSIVATGASSEVRMYVDGLTDSEIRVKIGVGETQIINPLRVKSNTTIEGDLVVNGSLKTSITERPFWRSHTFFLAEVDGSLQKMVVNSDNFINKFYLPRVERNLTITHCQVMQFSETYFVGDDKYRVKLSYGSTPSLGYTQTIDISMPSSGESFREPFGTPFVMLENWFYQIEIQVLYDYSVITEEVLLWIDGYY